MTVCVGGIAMGGNAMVVAVDQMLTIGGTSTGDMSEFAKSMRVHPYWYAAYSGDVAQVPQVLGRVTNLLGRYKRPPVERVTDIFLKAYADHQARITAQGADEPFDLQFLVGGFDPNGSPRLFTISPSPSGVGGLEGRYDFPGFYAIGIGADKAIDHLMLRDYKTHQQLEDSIYQIAEAKFVAESLISVGAKTSMAILFEDSRIGLMTAKNSDALKQIWLTEVKTTLPSNLDQRVPSLVKIYKGVPVNVIKQTRKSKAKKKKFG